MDNGNKNTSIDLTPPPFAPLELPPAAKHSPSPEPGSIEAVGNEVTVLPVHPKVSSPLLDNVPGLLESESRLAEGGVGEFKNDEPESEEEFEVELFGVELPDDSDSDWDLQAVHDEIFAWKIYPNTESPGTVHNSSIPHSSVSEELIERSSDGSNVDEDEGE